MTTVDNFFESFKGAESVVCQKVDDTYFNGQFFSPLLKYFLNISFEGGEIQMYYEIQVTLFNQPTVTIGAFGDKHRCSIKCHFVLAERMAEFHIEKRGLLQMIFKPRPDKYHIVKAKDDELHSRLLGSNDLNIVYKIAESTSQFAPSITGKSDGALANTYLIDVQFGTNKFHAEALYSLINFCKTMIHNNTTAANTGLPK